VSSASTGALEPTEPFFPPSFTTTVRQTLTRPEAGETLPKMRAASIAEASQLQARRANDSGLPRRGPAEQVTQRRNPLRDLTRCDMILGRSEQFGLTRSEGDRHAPLRRCANK